MKVILFSSYEPPSVHGFPDKFVVLDDATGAALMHDSCSCCPNPGKTINGLLTPWEKVYGWVAPGKYFGQCIQHETFGKCIIINGGQAVPSRISNVNHNGQKIVSEVFVHHSFPSAHDPNWRGSAGCFTMPKKVFDAFIALFSIGETLEIHVIDCAEMRAPKGAA